MKKISKMSELAWVLGTALCALGVAFCTKANFGLSMIAAPPYILHIAISKFWAFFTQGTAEYFWQALVIVFICIIVRKIRLRYLLAFLSAVISGFMIDFWLWILGGGGQYGELWQRVLAFVVGESIIALAVAFLFRTYCPMQAVDLVVVEISAKYKLDINRVKLFNDLILLALSVILTLTLTGGFVGVGVGTLIITLVNSPLIKLFGKLLDKIFEFTPAFPKFKEFLSKI